MDIFLQRPKFYFTLVGIWPIAKSKWSWVYFLYSILTTHLISYLFLTSLILDIYFNLDNIDIVTEACFILMTHMTFLMKFLCFTSRKTKFIELLEVVKDPIFRSFELDQEKYIRDWSTFTNMYTKLFFVSASTCAVIFVAVPLFVADNILPFRGWFPMEIKTSIFNWTIAYLFQFYSVAILVTTNIHLDCLPCNFMNIGCAQIEILKDSLENVVSRAEKICNIEEPNIEDYNRRKIKLFTEIGDNYIEMLNKNVDDKVQKMLGKYVEHHIAIIRLFDHIQQVFSAAMFTQFFAVVVTLCLTGFQLVVIPQTKMKYITAISYLVNVLFEITIYCWNGDQVTYQSSNIANSCYSTEWYRCSTKMRKIIFIIMERAKYPIYITAGRFFIVSIVTLTGILRSSYSYFAVLRNVYEQY